MTRMVAVGSGKGGVGKTWLAICLAHALSRTGLRTLLVDSDVGLANVDVQLGLAKGRDLAAVLAAGEPLSRCLYSDPVTGMDIIAGRSGAGRPTAPVQLWSERLVAELQALHDGYDIIVVDLPSGIDQGVCRLMKAADDKVVITTDEPTALTDAYALIKLTRKLDPDVVPKVAINFADNHRGGQATLEGFARVCERFLSLQPQPLGVIRRDRHVADAIGRQKPLLVCHPESDAAQDVSNAAKAIAALVRFP
ncbi:MAG: AAA family ATPase [Geminicoccaceae bacterium]